MIVRLFHQSSTRKKILPIGKMQQSIFDFGTLGQPNDVDFNVPTPINETHQERRNRLARERRARQRTQQNPYPTGESARDRKNRLARERYARSRDARMRSRQVIDALIINETRQERRNRLARERRTRQRTQRNPYPIGESARDRKNRFHRFHQEIEKIDARLQSRQVIDARLTGEREMQADEVGPFR